MSHKFVHVGDTVQLVYSPERRALGEYLKGQHWIFAGWLWEGQVHTIEEARARAAEYVKGHTS